MADEQIPSAPDNPQAEAAPAPVSPPDREDLQEQLEEARKAADQYKDQLLRKAADFENFRRRAAAESAALIRNANERLLRSLLPVLDDMDRFLKQGKTAGESDPFYQGAVLIAQKLERLLQVEGLQAFDSVGKTFNVEYHDAVQQFPRDGVPPHVVLEEVERGYALHGRVIRHAKVVVSAPAADLPEDAAENRDTPARTDGE